MRKVVSRGEVIDVLQKWLKGEVDEEELYRWAGSRYSVSDYDVEDREEDDSITNEVLGHLDMMDMNLVVKEDIPAMIEFLNTPKGKFNEGYSQWARYTKSINYKQRKEKLRHNPFYKTYCQE